MHHIYMAAHTLVCIVFNFNNKRSYTMLKTMKALFLENPHDYYVCSNFWLSLGALSDNNRTSKHFEHLFYCLKYPVLTKC